MKLENLEKANKLAKEWEALETKRDDLETVLRHLKTGIERTVSVEVMNYFAGLTMKGARIGVEASIHEINRKMRNVMEEIETL